MPALLAALQSVVGSRFELGAEIKLSAVLQRQTPKRPRLGHADRWLCVLIVSGVVELAKRLSTVRPDTVRALSDKSGRSFRFEPTRVKHPGTIGRRMLRLDLASLDRQAKGSGTDAEPVRGFRQIHPSL